VSPMAWMTEPSSGSRLGNVFSRHRLVSVTAVFRRPASETRTAWIATLSATVLLLAGSLSRPVHAEAPSANKALPADRSAWLVEQSAFCISAAQQAEQRYHLPHGLLMAIAKAESGRPINSFTDVRPWPWTIDADGTGLFLDSKPAAVAWVTTQIGRHSFVDVGCMQVDLEYHPHAFASLEQAFDPVMNTDYAARLLLRLYLGEAGGSWDLAVGLYHSHTSLLAAMYRDRVAMIGTDIERGTLAGVPLYVRAMRQGTLQLPLSGGRTASINVHRQPALRARHSYTVCQIERILGPYLNGRALAAACPAALPKPASLARTEPEAK
jgi:hypothetical protein